MKFNIQNWRVNNC